MIASFQDQPGILLSGEEPQFTIAPGYTTYKFLFNPFASINDEISYFYSKQFGTKQLSLSQIKTMGKIVLPIYQQLIGAGDYLPFEFHEARHAPSPTQSSRLAREIADISGLDFLFVWSYLSCLESLAKAGIIDLKHYNPPLKDIVTATEAHPIADAVAFLKNSPEAVTDFIKSATGPVDTASRRIVIVAAIALGGFALITVNKVIPKRR